MAAAALDEETATAVGGPRMQAVRSGTVDNVAMDEDDLFAQIRTVLSYLPTNVDEEPPFLDVGDPPDRWCDELLDIVPDNRRRPFNAQQMIEAVVDDGSFFELAPAYGRALVAGLARVAGQAVGVFSSNPYVNAGAMDLPACEKQTRVAELCDTFHLPMVYFADVPGFMIGIEAERSGLMRRGVRAMQAVHRATVPVVTVQVRRSYGLAGNATGAPNRLSVKIAWPLGEWGDMPIEGGVDALFRRELEASDDPAALRDRIEARMQAAASIWGTAESFGVEDIIDPRDTRRVLSRWIAAATAHRKVGPKQGPQVRP
jgi:acetyl-CoA carboxylase carboxyltransferase component